MKNATGPMTPPPRAASTEYYRLDDDRDVLTAEPTPLVEVRSLPGVQRHAAAHIEDIVPYVQILDVGPVGGPALVEQVIAVPKIFMDRVPQRSVCRRSRRAEQLVEVPTIVSYSSLQQRPAKQTVDIPVPHGRGDRGGGRVPQGSRPGQNSTVLVEQNVDIPVPQGRGGRVGHGGLQCVSQGQGSTDSSSSSHVGAGAADDPFQGVFRTFPQMKKSAGLVPHSGSELSADFNP